MVDLIKRPKLMRAFWDKRNQNRSENVAVKQVIVASSILIYHVICWESSLEHLLEYSV